MSRCPSRSTQAFGSCGTLDDGVNAITDQTLDVFTEEDILKQLQDCSSAWIHLFSRIQKIPHDDVEFPAYLDN